VRSRREESSIYKSISSRFEICAREWGENREANSDL
jgi:hypothetical protein